MADTAEMLKAIAQMLESAEARLITSGSAYLENKPAKSRRRLLRQLKPSGVRQFSRAFADTANSTPVNRFRRPRSLVSVA